MFGVGPSEWPPNQHNFDPIEDGLSPEAISMGRTMKEALEKFPADVQGIAHSWRVPRLTKYIDAALQITPAEADWSAGERDGVGWALIRTPQGEHRAEGASAAIALCIAHCEMVGQTFERLAASA